MGTLPVQRARWHVFPDDAALQANALARVLAAAQDAIAQRGAFDIVLAGGNTPRRLYRALRAAAADWARWHIWLGDERCLPVGDAERNSAMARAEWLNHVPLPAANFHAIPAELDGAEAAARYARELAGVDAFDVVLLGLGEDGHTASLFAGRDLGAAGAAPDVLAVHDAPKPPPERVSLSVARLARARRVLFLVAGESKRAAVAAWRAGADLPAAAIRPASGVDVLVEEALLA